jgi:inner membrane protein
VDPVSQASIGAVAAQALSRRTPLLTALWVGALGGFLPDADILIRSSDDPLLALEYHRHFTHSLLFIPIGGLIAAALGKLLTRGKRTIRELWLPAALGWATHGLLDSCTSYGTYLFWPFSDVRVAWNTVSIVDLLFTLPILIGAILAVRKQSRALATAALVWALAYLSVGVVQRDRAAAVYAERIAERGHTAERMEVKPSLGNNILFRAFYIHGDTYYADAVRVPWWGEGTVYEGDSIPALDITALRATLDPVHQHDLDRFAHFSDGFLVEDPLHPGVIGDFRYAMVPNAIAPLWGIDLGGGAPGKHLAFERFSATSGAQRQAMLDQLWGRSPPEAEASDPAP